MKRNVIAVLTADWHLMHHTWKRYPEISGDAFVSLYQICNLAASVASPVIAAGDLFDVKQPKPFLLLETRFLLANSQGFYIQGNHEIQSSPWLDLVTAGQTTRHTGWTHLSPDKPCVIPDLDIFSEVSGVLEETEPLFRKAKNWCLHGIDFCNFPDKLENALAEAGKNARKNPEYAHLLVLHQAAKPLMPFQLGDLEDGMIPEGIDLVLVGHAHVSRVFTLKNTAGKPVHCVSPGSIHLWNIAEDPEKSVCLLCADGSLLTVPLKVRQVFREDWKGSTETEVEQRTAALLETLEEAPKLLPILHALLDENTTHRAETIVRETLADRVHWFPQLVRSGAGAVTGEDAEEIDVQTYSETGFEYARSVFQQAEEDEAVREILETLLTEDPLAETYDKIKNNFLGGVSCCFNPHNLSPSQDATV
jgi:DNA repair exonuclease SbcCD nuclease subunit